MSLTTLITEADVRERFKQLRPKLSRQISGSIKAPSTYVSHPTVIGTAFDYLLRFEVKRRAPHARDRTWIAERAATSFVDDSIQARALRVVDAAKTAVDDFTKINRMPTPVSLRAIAGHAIKLARLDPVFRSGYFDPEFDRVPDDEDVDDLLSMLEIVPYNDLVTEDRISLNPGFGFSSGLVGGADADIIAGNLLVDIKTTRKAVMSGKELDQILGYFLLSRNEVRDWKRKDRYPQKVFDKSFNDDSRFKEILLRNYKDGSPKIKLAILNALDPRPPEIKRAGFYFSRYGLLWEFDVDEWLDHPSFFETEKWFIEHIHRKCEQRRNRYR